MVAFVLALGALLTETRTRSRPTATLALLALAALAFSTDRFAVYQGGSPAARAADGTPITLALEPAGPGAQCWGAPQPCTPVLRPGLHVTRLLGRPAFLLR